MSPSNASVSRVKDCDWAANPIAEADVLMRGLLVAMALRRMGTARVLVRPDQVIQI